MDQFEFESFPKIGRLNRDCTITEKIDGTNAQILFSEEGIMLVGSRKRQIWPEGTEGKSKGCDNMAFANWAYDNQGELFKFLGPGRHYGEWAGRGIQRGYGLESKRFYLFNTFRWGVTNAAIPQELYSIGLDSVPVLYEGAFCTGVVNDELEYLKLHGSMLNSDFTEAEGLMVYHHGLRVYAKVTCKKDEGGKGPNNQSPV
jgi:hypothetical protein